MHSERFTVDTAGRTVVELTDRVLEFARDRGQDGLVSVFLPHATAGLALIETGAGSENDLGEAIEKILPREERYAHRHGSTGHGADHLLPAFVSPSLVLPVEAGRVSLGTWQRVVLVDTNRENNDRTVILSFLSG
jgi:secondary thiamine-phosphate synthase enzyme